jgi:NAD(P)-dependent dehydrogenase (short-subunit alcohol dehydrogenase family)
MTIAPVMKEQGSGKIITVGSVAGVAPSADGGYAHYGHYGADKAAIAHYTRYPAQVLPRGLSANENVRALISIVARSTKRSNQRPDTLMQDRQPTDRRKPLATHGRTIHRVRRGDSAQRAHASAFPQ